MIDTDKLMKIYREQYDRTVERNGRTAEEFHLNPHRVALVYIYDYGFENGLSRGMNE